MRFAGLSATSEPGITILLTLLLGVAVQLPAAERFFLSVENGFCWLARQKWLAVGAVFALVLGARLALVSLLPVPNPGIHDEFSYLLMADTFAHGRLANPPHAMWMSFETFHVLWFPAYASKYPPAQGLVLMLGQLVGHPWIGVLLSAAAMGAAVTWALKAWLPGRWALLAGLLVASKLCLVTYWMNSYWGGAVAAFGGALAVGALGRLRRGGGTGNAVALAAGVAILLNSRPYESVFFCVPVAVVLFRWLAGEGSSRAAERRRSVLLPAAAILLLTFAWMAYYNWRVTGNPLEIPYSEAVKTYDRSALFLWQKAKPPRHYNSKELDVFYNRWERENFDRSWDGAKDITWQKLTRSAAIFAWPALLLALPGLCFVYRDRRARFLAAIVLAVATAFAVSAWPNPHYVAPCVVAIFALMVQSLRHLRTLTVFGRPLGRALSRVVVLALLVDVAESATQGNSDPLGWGGYGLSDRAEIQRQLEETPGKHLVMVRYVDHHSVHEEWVYNGADLDGAKVLWGRDLEPRQNAKLFAYYKDRTIWLVEPGSDSVSLTEYRPGPVGDYEPEY
jgi:hypothetical protein